MVDKTVHQFGIALCNLLKTSQEPSYHDHDDGYNKFGIAHDYKVMSTGDQSGTTAIVINGKTHNLSNNCVRDNAVLRNGKPIVWARYVPLGNIGPAADGKLFWDQWVLAAKSCTFNAAAKTVTAAAGIPFNVNTLCVGRKIGLTGTVDNNKEVTVAGITDSVITTEEVLTNEGPVNTTFATKDDLIWNLRDQANAGDGLGGFTDWDIPNSKELFNIIDIGCSNPSIDTTVFPSTPATSHWTASTDSNNSDNAYRATFLNGNILGGDKLASKFYVRLVRS